MSACVTGPVPCQPSHQQGGEGRWCGRGLVDHVLLQAHHAWHQSQDSTQCSHPFPQLLPVSQASQLAFPVPGFVWCKFPN
jgi:hypothetical protein